MWSTHALAYINSAKNKTVYMNTVWTEWGPERFRYSNRDWHMGLFMVWLNLINGMSEQLLVRLTKLNSSREIYSLIWQNTRNNYTQALLTESLRWVSEDRLKIPSFVIFYINYLLFIYEWLFTWMFICCCCNLMMFYDWSECTMSVLGTTKHSSCNCIDTWQ